MQDWQSAEIAAARWMRQWGYRDAAITGSGADAGIDVRSKHALAQVKFTDKPVGRQALQQLMGARSEHSSQKLLFFSRSGYSAVALEYANERRIACFQFVANGSLDCCNKAARSLLKEQSHTVTNPPRSTLALKRSTLLGRDAPNPVSDPLKPVSRQKDSTPQRWLPRGDVPPNQGRAPSTPPLSETATAPATWGAVAFAATLTASLSVGAASALSADHVLLKIVGFIAVLLTTLLVFALYGLWREAAAAASGDHVDRLVAIYAAVATVTLVLMAMLSLAPQGQSGVQDLAIGVVSLLAMCPFIGIMIVAVQQRKNRVAPEERATAAGPSA